MAGLPYVTATGNIERALLAIKNAATPPTVSQDFVKTILGIPGGSGSQMTSFLRKIGFVGQDGKPTVIYTRFRSTDSETSGAAVADALRFGYAPLYARNEYMHSLSDDKLKGLIIEETGAGGDSNVASMVLNCIKSLKKHAIFASKGAIVVELDPGKDKLLKSESGNGSGESENGRSGENSQLPRSTEGVGLNLAYTINLNLPATSDIAVFNAIFKSLKENLLKSSNG
ncbi:DUF5343 domain-containing protein [Paralcaligenes ureilyticus]|uniref:Uncharacterized protein n=1 Tax=Paralcaligenes ureilyticus TaxID=627131 RepID=A0A4R3MF20_9BURK|nr:DUF5343 domain-containing protein [Paralcaligenes ureilyticus]TCT10817.1 hypothetical protein EDC26_10136 [Paralcaligenes ureilyticus]